MLFLIVRAFLAARRQNASVGYRQIAFFGERLLPNTSQWTSSDDSPHKELGTANIQKFTVQWTTIMHAHAY
jgi:hypothetical protein